MAAGRGPPLGAWLAGSHGAASEGGSAHGSGRAALVPRRLAGLYLPALTAARRCVVGYVFVDAGLPPRDGRVPLAAGEFHDFLAARADENGVLPPWTDWWDEDVADLFPSAEVRELVEREQQRLPLSYFGESLPVPPGWDDKPGTYLAFGDTYASEREDASRRGWKVSTLRGEHLHMLVNPAEVAAELAGLVSGLGVARPRSGSRTVNHRAAW